MPIEIEYEEDGVEVKVMCDACSRDYTITCEDTAGLHLCPFCGNYLDGATEEGIDQDESETSSWG